MKVRNDGGRANERRTLDGLETARLLYGPLDERTPDERHAHETDEHLLDFARAAGHVAGMLFDRFPDEVREAFRWGREDAARNQGCDRGGINPPGGTR